MIDYTKKGPTRTKRKRCTKCGGYGYYEPRDRKCRLTKFRGGIPCYGNLEVVRRPKKEVSPADALRKAIEQAALVSPEDAAAADKIRADARVKLAKTQRHMTTLVQKAARVAKLLDKYQRRANYYAKRADISNAEVAKERASRKSKDLAAASSPDDVMAAFGFSRGQS